MSDVDKPHPITLEAMFFTKSCVIAVPGHEPSPEIIKEGPTNDIKIEAVPDDRGFYQAIMTCKMNLENDKRRPYSIDMECLAFLRADDTLSDEDKVRGVHITAHNVCYGAIREAVLWITGRQPYGPLQLGLSVLRGAPKAVVEEKK